MPRPKKVIQEEPVLEPAEIALVEEVVEEIEEVVETMSDVVEENIVVEEPQETTNLSIYNVYHLGTFVETVEENSESLHNYLEKNRNQLLQNINKLLEPTTNDEDLVLFNIPPTDNRKYNSLAQYYQQNGLAPQTPRINNWMTYYKWKYPLATDEEIAIQVFGPLDFSFDIAS